VPEPATLAAFAVDGAQGFTLHADTWHHGLIALDAGDFVVIERRAAEVDCEFAELALPVTLRP
jgi:ureidoglycolate lyase